MKRLCLTISLFGSVFLSGCVFAPGQNVTPNSLFDSSDEPEVEVIPITAKLLATDPVAVNVTDEQIPAELLSYKPEPYAVGPGDSLYVTVWDHPELTTPAGTTLGAAAAAGANSGPLPPSGVLNNNSDANGRVIRADGTFFYPYIGQVHAAGLSLEALRSELTKRLAKYIDAPQVDVAVLRYASQKVYLSGAFQNAGSVAITIVPLKLTDAVGQGFVGQDADISGLQLIRDGISYNINLDRLGHNGKALSKIILKADDSLYLPYRDRRNVYVLGEVSAQRAIPFRTDGISIAEALATVGGLRQDTAKPQSVYVIRGYGEGAKMKTTVYQMSANSPTALALAGRFKLQSGDTVYVGPAQITRWNRFISQLIPSAGLISTASAVDYNTSNAR